MATTGTLSFLVYARLPPTFHLQLFPFLYFSIPSVCPSVLHSLTNSSPIFLPESDSGFQLWVNLPKSKKMIPAAYQDLLDKDVARYVFFFQISSFRVCSLRCPVPRCSPLVHHVSSRLTLRGESPDGKVKVKIIAGEAYGKKAPTVTQTEILYFGTFHLLFLLNACSITVPPTPLSTFTFVTLLTSTPSFHLISDVNVDPSGQHEVDIPSSENGLIYVLEGVGTIGETELAKGEAGILAHDHDLLVIENKVGEGEERTN